MVINMDVISLCGVDLGANSWEDVAGSGCWDRTCLTALVRCNVVQELHLLQVNCLRLWVPDLRALFAFSTYSALMIRSKCKNIVGADEDCAIDARPDEMSDAMLIANMHVCTACGHFPWFLFQCYAKMLRWLYLVITITTSTHGYNHKTVFPHGYGYLVITITITGYFAQVCVLPTKYIWYRHRNCYRGLCI